MSSARATPAELKPRRTAFTATPKVVARKNAQAGFRSRSFHAGTGIVFVRLIEASVDRFENFAAAAPGVRLLSVPTARGVHLGENDTLRERVFLTCFEACVRFFLVPCGGAHSSLGSVPTHRGHNPAPTGRLERFSRSWCIRLSPPPPGTCRSYPSTKRRRRVPEASACGKAAWAETARATPGRSRSRRGEGWYARARPGGGGACCCLPYFVGWSCLVPVVLCELNVHESER